MNIPVFDAHCDTICEVLKQGTTLRKNDLHIDLERGLKFSPYAQVFAVFIRPWETETDYLGMDFSKDWDADVVEKMGFELLQNLLSELEKNTDILTLCRSAGEAKTAAKDRKIAAFIAVEGAELIGCDIKKLHTAYDLGVRLVNLSWNFDNALCGAANGLDKGGLTEKGRVYVREMQKLGMVIDLSHASEKTFWEVAESATGPIIAGHSNSKTVCDHPRNLTDAQFCEIVGLGGVVGLNLCPSFLNEKGDAGIADVIRHAEHFLSLGGEKALCLGGDLDGIDRMPTEMSGIQDYGKIYEAMIRNNWKESLVRDIFYNNLMMVLEKTL